MKKLISIHLLLFITLSMQAQKQKPASIPAAAKTSFKSAYPGISGKWEKEEDNFEVNFKKAGKTMSIVMDSKGSILETETEISISELPASVTQYVKQHYQNEKIKEAAIIEKSGGEKNYEANVGKKDLIFDANGKFIKTSKE